MASDGSIDRRTKNPKAKRDFHLPIDILGVILRRLPRFGDRVRFRYICRYWNSIEREHPPPPQLPWLFLPSHDKSGIPSFFSPSDDAVHCLRLPEGAPGDRCLGSCEGWLFLADQEIEQLVCINPSLKSVVLLPSLINLSNELYKPLNVSMLMIYKAISSASPASPGCLIAAIKKFSYFLCLCWPGSSNSWSVNGDCSTPIADIIFYEGKLLALTLRGELIVFEVGDGYSGEPVVARADKWAVERHIDLWEACGPHKWVPGRTYLVESSGGGKIWAVLRCWHFALNGGLRSNEFRVYELDRSSGPFRWVEIESLGDRILFVSGKASKAFVASEVQGCQGDCIYFADEDFDRPRSYNPQCTDSGVYSMRDRSIRTFFPPRYGVDRPTIQNSVCIGVCHHLPIR